MKSGYSKSHHSGGGRNPAKTRVPQSGHNCVVVPLSREVLINWISAFAGMTSQIGDSK
jgi:hypothetical protein